MKDKSRLVKRIRSKREYFWERAWASTIIFYSFGATFVVWKGLAKYGVNPIFFFIIDVCTSWPYGIATARLAVDVVRRDWKDARKWALVAIITFFTPQVYILIVAHHVPKDVYLIIIAVIICLTIFAIVALIQQIRSTRAKI